MKSWKQLLFLVFSVIILFSEASQTYGQRYCLPSTQYQDLPYWRANLVFIGTVEKFTIDKQANLDDKRTLTTDTYTLLNNVVWFAVEKSYRGNIGKNIEITSSFYVKEGKKYLVYAIEGKDGKTYQLDNGECGTPPILLDNAKYDIDYAEEIAAGKSGTRISGSVYEDFRRLGIQRQNLPIANVEVTIKNEKNSFTTKTDEKGKYIFKNIPAGVYKITASAPKDLHEQTLSEQYFWQRGLKPNVVVIGESTAGLFMTLSSYEKPKPYYRHSDSYNFFFTSLSSIEGKAVDSDGKVPHQQYVWLIPFFNGKARDYNIQPTWTNRADGKFIFEGVPRGDYVIAVNRDNCHTNYHPEYGKNFFPGVADLSNAEIITVGENQNLKLKDFRLSVALKERWISGVVLTADKKPMANAAVFLTTKNQKTPNECFSFNIETKADELGRFKIKVYESYEYKIYAYIQPTEQRSSRLFSKILELPISGNIENIELIVDSK